ncbi:MAG: hypothetical protein JXA93_09555 [Anaerolineae bacterium]|nr:hypothetical protein [Anaerolineae bacterium]
MKRVLFLVLLVGLVAALLAACGEVPATQPAPSATPEPTDVPPTAGPTTPPPAAREWVVYDDNEFFTLEYPAEWEIVERTAENSVLFLTPQTADDDLFRENMGVLRQELDDPSTTVGDYTREFLAAAPEMIDNFQVVRSEPAKLSGLPAHRVVYAGSQGGMLLGWQQVWTISDGHAYILTYTADPAGFDPFLDDANSIIESFTLK